MNTIKITIDDDKVINAANRLLVAGRDHSPAIVAIAVHLENRARESLIGLRA